jgi:hypothetical protein
VCEASGNGGCAESGFSVPEREKYLVIPERKPFQAGTALQRKNIARAMSLSFVWICVPFCSTVAPNDPSEKQQLDGGLRANPGSMRGSEATKKEAGRRGFAASFYPKDENGSNSPELTLNPLDTEKKTEPAWTFRSRGARMEGIAVSLWAWLVVGILSAWFAIWFMEAVGRLGAKVP